MSLINHRNKVAPDDYVCASNGNVYLESIVLIRNESCLMTRAKICSGVIWLMHDGKVSGFVGEGSFYCAAYGFMADRGKLTVTVDADDLL